MKKLPKTPGSLLMHRSGTLAVLWETGTWLIFDRLGVIELKASKFQKHGLDGWERAERKHALSSVCIFWPQEMTPY